MSAVALGIMQDGGGGQDSEQNYSAKNLLKRKNMQSDILKIILIIS
jgi:hypothetical protein